MANAYFSLYDCAEFRISIDLLIFPSLTSREKSDHNCEGSLIGFNQKFLKTRDTELHNFFYRKLLGSMLQFGLSLIRESSNVYLLHQ